MRYTRYEYKKSGKIKFLGSVAIIAGISITAGIYGSKLIFSERGINENKSQNYSNEQIVKENGKKIIAIQCGYYSSIDNAQSALSLIPSDYSSFIVQDEDKYRLIAGVYEYDEGMTRIDSLTNQGVANTKLEFVIPEDTNENKSVLEIVDGFLKIINKLNDTEIKSIKTADYKSWARNVVKENNLEQGDFYTVIDTYLNNIPEEIDKTNSKDSVKETYELIKKYKIVR